MILSIIYISFGQDLQCFAYTFTLKNVSDLEVVCGGEPDL